MHFNRCLVVWGQLLNNKQFLLFYLAISVTEGVELNMQW